MNEKGTLRILVGGYHEESNAFNPLLCTIEDFRNGTYHEGLELLEKNRGKASVIGGIIAAVEEAGAECIPAVLMHARSSGGPVDFSTAEHFVEKMIQYIEKERDAEGDLRIDGIFLFLHGSTQAPEEDDVCGYIVETIRKTVGPEVVITVGCDLHANVTTRMMKHADFISGYQTYPHVDHYNTGYRSAMLGMHKVLGGEKLYTARIALPMIVPASGYSNTSGAFKEVMDLAHSLAEQYKARDFSVFQMQPWLDVAEAASTVLVVSEDPDVAGKMAKEIAQKLFDNRDGYWPKLMSMDDIIRRAYENKQPDKPVVLVDMADSPNGGAVADSAAVLLRLMELNLPVRTCTVVRDKEAVEQAFRAGVGGEEEFTFGGKLTPGDASGPATVKARVISLHDGVFMREGNVSRHTICHIGHSAVIQAGNMTVLLCERPSSTGDTQIYRHFGIEPTFYDLVVVKANTSFKACYESIAAEICYADTPGACAADLCSLPFTRIPREGFYPFDHLDGFVIPEAVIY
jgi:microcystin degradation protein MlrC